MTRPLRIQYPGALYHITNRGNERKAIFSDDMDRESFLSLLSQSVGTYNIVLHSFVLMENHWHFLAQTPLGNLSEFMRHFNIIYTSYYNRRHKRSGHLYQGRYKSFLVEADSYLSTVSRYIHLNPVRISTVKKGSIKKQCDYLWKYPWSSLPGYLTRSKESSFVEYALVLSEYGGHTKRSKERYKKQIVDDLTAGLSIREHVFAQSILGRDPFISWVRERYVDSKNDRERPSVSKISQFSSVERFLTIIEEETGLSNLLQATGTTRQIVMTILYNYGGLNNREIGDLLGLDYSTVSQGRKRLREKAEKIKELKALLDRISAKVSRIKI